MGSVKVTVYGRVKPCLKNCRSQGYNLKNGDHDDQITFISNKYSAGKKTYRFRKIFTENSSQEDVFETVAKPIIKSVLTGYNGTIFTYGQTGSGKTYTMTGDIEEWLNPGLIPRTVQEIFKQKARDTTITITYCEIYNEHVYDLIRVDRLDPDLPQVSLLEDSSGITHFRNLSVHLVGSALEALQLLIRGDANKMVAETSSNAKSSRSHVIFSIGLEFPHPTEEKLCLKPVLYLVDLAGSEKLSKCKTPMSNPMETRYINLSLHYLEQVLIALRQPGRNHIPYRNSLMTALLRNSLGGNCITAMIATFSLSLDDLEETMQTCRFAERIALIKNEMKLNELVNPQKEINLLRKENNKLRTQLRIMSFPQAPEELTEKDRVRCAEMVKNFIKGNDIFDLPLSDIKRLEYCFHLMREEIVKSARLTFKKTERIDKEVLEALRKEPSVVNNLYVETRYNEGSRVKIIESSNNRKRTPMDLPKINLTYKRWKSTEQITENGCNVLKKFSSKEIKAVDSDFSNSSFPYRKAKEITIEPSTKKPEEKPPSREKDNMDAYVKDGCFVIVRDSELSTKHSSSLGIMFQDERARKSTSLVNAAGSNASLKNDFQGPMFDSDVKPQSPFSSDEALTYKDIKKLINVGIQVDHNGSLDSQNTETSSYLNIEAPSTHSLDADIFSGKSLPLTGDKEVDEEILKFYKARYQSLKKS